MTSPESPYVRDPLNPTDAELSAAITRGIELGQLLTVEDFLAEVGLVRDGEAQPGAPAAGTSPGAAPEAETEPEAEA